MSNAQLTAKVKAVNRANAYALELYPKLAGIFMPFVGQQIEKKGGSLLLKIAKLVPEFPREPHVFRYGGNHSLAWLVKTCEMHSEHSCLYHETMVYVGYMRNHVLESLCDPPKFRTDYSVEEIMEARGKYQAAQKIADDLRSTLFPFGE